MHAWAGERPAEEQQPAGTTGGLQSAASALFRRIFDSTAGASSWPEPGVSVNPHGCHLPAIEKHLLYFRCAQQKGVLCRAWHACSAQEAPSIGDLIRPEAIAAAPSDALVGQSSGNPFTYDSFKGFELPKASSAAAAALHEAAGLLASQASAEHRNFPQGAHDCQLVVHIAHALMCGAACRCPSRRRT